MTPVAFHYHAPATVDDAVRILAEHGEEARVLAGGQSLVAEMAARLARPAHIIDINRLGRADQPAIAAGRLRIPPLMRHADFTPDVADGPLGPLLAELAGAVGPLPVRLRGTFCGALAQADPAAEWCLAAVVLNADIVLRSHARGVRNVRGGAFFETMFTTVLADDELIVEVQVPLLGAGVRTGFARLGRAKGHYGAALALAVHGREGEMMRDVRVGLGGVEAVPRRIPEAERVLEGEAAGAAVFAEAAEAAAAAVVPAETGPEGVAYTRELAREAVFAALGRTGA